jgi:hypothetical protein
MEEGQLYYRESKRSKLQAPVTERVHGRCQALSAKDPDTLGLKAVMLATVGAESPNSYVLP